MSLFAALLVGCNSGTSKRTGEHSKKDNNSKTDQMKSAYSHWLGSWQRTEWQNDAGLDIDSIVLDTLVFHLGASNGGNSGEIDGSAKINGNKAAYFSDEDGDSCLLEFEISGDTLIVVNQVKGDCFAGSGVEYSGKYYSTKIKPSSTKEENEEDLLSLGRFNNPQDDSLFRALTGKDYDLFVSSTQLTSDDSDLDNFNATVSSSGVRGLFTEMENIIMINARKDIWAAVINDDTVYYYTNKKDWEATLPKTINDWRKAFIQYPVINKSDK